MLVTATCHKDVRAIEARAHAMRAEFMRELVQLTGQWLRIRFSGHRAAKLA